MQGIGDPDLFELSEVVEKSSKTGIFTNKRLLMIKDGYLYYYSTVPSNYKGHQPNLMATLKQYPKSSIQIKAIHNIRPQSQKSATLIIEFYQKDMIDREDIRKSLSSKTYNHPPLKELTTDIEEWKFTFVSFNKCKQWYYYLEYLKAHFEKHQDRYDKFTEYMANFDSQLRQSLPRYSHTQPQSPNNNQVPSAIFNKPIASSSINQKYQIANPIQEQKDEDNNSYPNSKRLSIQENILQQQLNDDKRITDIINHAQNHTNIPIEDIVRNTLNAYNHQTKSPEVSKRQIKQNIDSPVETLKQMDNKEEKQLDTKETKEQKKEEPKQQKKQQQQKESSEQEITKAIQQATQSIREEERKKSEQKAQLLQEYLTQKEKRIEEMEKELQMKRKIQLQLQEQLNEETYKRQQEERLRLILEREKKEEQQYRKLKQSIGSQPSIEKVQEKEACLIEQSIQTEFDRQFIDVLENATPQSDRIARMSIGSDYGQLPFTNLVYHTSHASQQSSYPEEKNYSIEHFDFYWQLGQLYVDKTSSQKVKRQLQMTQFVRQATKQATNIVISYIDECKPQKNTKIERFMFEIEIVCEQGRVIRTEGRQRLVYSNEQHQRLKRTFKIYNKLTQSIISTLKKKPAFPLRVPFCCLIQYKGYSALVQIIPPRRTLSKNSHLLRNLGSDFRPLNFKIEDFENSNESYTLLILTKPYKSTNQQTQSQLQQLKKGFDFLEVNRRNYISIESKKLFDEAESLQNNKEERLSLAKMVSFCRELKKVMKANTPYLETHRQLQFFEHFLRDPSKFIDEQGTESQPVTGILFHYCERLLGIKMKSRYGQQQYEYLAVPVVRGFTLRNLDISLFAQKFEKMCFENKFELAKQALRYSKELQYDYLGVLVKQINLVICMESYAQALQKIELVLAMISTHDPRKLIIIALQAQCCQALGRVEQSMAHLKFLLEETEYLYQNKGKLVEVYFLIAGILSRQNLHNELIEVYRTILRVSPSSRHRVVLEYAQFLLGQESDPHILLDFIQENVKHYSKTAEAQLLLGDVYFKCRNYPKAVSFYQTAFQTNLQLKNHWQQLIKSFSRLLECTQQPHQKRQLHRQLVNHCSGHKLTFDFTQKINTIVSKIIFERRSPQELEKWINILEDRENINESAREAILLEWAELQQLILKAGSGDSAAFGQLAKSVDIVAFTEQYIAMTSSHVI